jgi:hypothetical protein
VDRRQSEHRAEQVVTQSAPRAGGATDERSGHAAQMLGIDFAVVPSRVLRVLLVIIVMLVALSTAGQVMIYYLPDFPLRDPIASLFYVDSEQSLPTLYSSVMLLLSALLFGSIAHAHRRRGRPYVRHLASLSVVFALLALDESASLHEQTVGPFRALLDIEGGFLWYAWVVPAAAAVALFVAVFTPFLRHLPRPTRLGLLAAGALFVGGAIGVELLGGSYASGHGQGDMTFVLIATAEETLEMLGIAVLFYTLLAYIPIGLPDAAWRIRVSSAD